MTRSRSRRGLIVLAILGVGAALGRIPSFAAQDPVEAPPMDPLVTGYAIGHDLGLHALAVLAEDDVAVDRDALLRGFDDAVRDVKPAYERAVLDGVLVRLEREVATRLATERLASDPVFKALAESNLARGRAFHEQFGKREGVVSLPSGLQYIVRKRGTGTQKPGLDDTIVVRFVGQTIDGYVFAEANDFTARVDALLPGGREIAQQMVVGDRFIVAFPAALAYGVAGRAPDIGPNESVLVDVTLVEVKP